MMKIDNEPGSTMQGLTVIVLTYNEVIHIRRCLDSALRVASEVIVVDSGSTDGTPDIAKQAGACVLHHDWINHAAQLNWVLESGEITTDWVMRLDADEYMDERLVQEIKHRIVAAPDDITGFEVKRIVIFQGKKIRFGGGVSPGRVLRLWRNSKGRCEQRWMDEHMILLQGYSRLLAGRLYDHSLKTLTWWVEKHNDYANREAVDILNQQYRFLGDTGLVEGLSRTARNKRLIKNVIYRRLPGGLRAVIYFIYRTVFRMGLLDGMRGMGFHFMQAFWYRVLVDMKIAETKRYMRVQKVHITNAIREILKIDVERKTESSNDSGGYPAEHM